MIPFLFLFAFGALSGVVGAALVGRLPFRGWPRVALGIVVSAVLFGVALVIQFTLFRFFGDDRSLQELTRTGLILIGACSVFWLPAFGLAFAALPTALEDEA